MTQKKEWGVSACSQYEENERFMNRLDMKNPEKFMVEQGEDTELQKAANEYPDLDLPKIAKLLETSERIPYNWVNSRNQNFLHLMILHEHLPFVAELAKHCNMFQRDFRGCTPLDSAIHLGNFEIVQILVNQNFNIVNMAVRILTSNVLY